MRVPSHKAPQAGALVSAFLQEIQIFGKITPLVLGVSRSIVRVNQIGRQELVLSAHKIFASVYDSQYLEVFLSQVTPAYREPCTSVQGYCAYPNEILLDARGLRSGMQQKAYQNRPLII